MQEGQVLDLFEIENKRWWDLALCLISGLIWAAVVFLDPESLPGADSTLILLFPWLKAMDSDVPLIICLGLILLVLSLAGITLYLSNLYFSSLSALFLYTAIVVRIYQLFLTPGNLYLIALGYSIAGLFLGALILIIGFSYNRD